MFSLRQSVKQLPFALLFLALVRVNVGAQIPPACQVTYTAPARILDCSHYSQVLGDGQPEQRFFRLFLPPDYDQATDAQGNPRRYAVVYFFHGWGQRYNQWSPLVGNYDTGDDRYGNDNLAFYVGQNKNLIIVKWDGFNPRYPGDTNPKPYNIDQVVTQRQFPPYFPELVQYIDANLRTIADRDHRGVSGLSMGGYMSFWVSGKYPHLVGSASSFMPSTELFAGPTAFPTEYSHTPMYGNYEGLYTRLIMGTQDFIRWYHRRMNAIWDYTRPEAYHEVEIFDAPHGTSGIAKTLDFHMHAFSNPLLQPEVWHHADIYPNFEVWGYAIESNRQRPGFTVLENVSATGFRSSVRESLPDGKLLPSVTLTITTDAVYQPGQHYSITDMNLDSSRVFQAQQTADANGRLTFTLSGDRHEIGISPIQTPAPIVTVADWRLAEAGTLPVNGKPVSVKLKFLNKGGVAATGWSAQVTSDPQVALTQSSLPVPSLQAGTAGEADLQFQVNDATREIVQLNVHISDGGGYSALVPVEIPVFADLPVLANLVLNDGSTVTMWEHATGKTHKALGTGNRDGVANPGETIALLLPDGGAYRGGEMFTFDPCIDRSSANTSAGQYLRGRLSDAWGNYDDVGASVKYSLPIISASCPPGHEIAFFVRYQMPNKPEHILKEGIVKVAVTGSDHTPPQPVVARVSSGVVQVDIREGSGVTSATATFTSNKRPRVTVPLNDAGSNGDVVAGDAIFSGKIGNAPAGTYTLDILTQDDHGNIGKVRVNGSFQLP